MALIYTPSIKVSLGSTSTEALWHIMLFNGLSQ